MMGTTHYAAGALFTAALAPPTANLLGVELSPGDLAIGVCIGTVAGVLPDIDHPDSLITKGLLPGIRGLGALGHALGWVLSLPPRVVGVGARATMNHRGGTHSITFMLGWTLLAAPIYSLMIAMLAFMLSMLMPILSTILFEPLLGQAISFNPSHVFDWLLANTPSVMPLVMISVFYGYLSHLVTDSMTKVPVPWPWPFSKKRYHILPPGFRVTTDSVVERGLIRPIIILLAVVAFVANIGVPLAENALDTVQQEENKERPQKKKQIDR
jgi:membrane-bound metal-dependent hydrolase YbcI (DUF457 family)